MDLQKTRAAARAGLSGLRAGLSGLRLRRAAALALGFCYGRAALAAGMAPLGLSYAAASGQPLWAAMGAFLGAAGTENGLIYMACAAVLYTCRLLFRDTAAMRRGWLMPLCAAGALLVTKSVVALESGGRGLLLLLCESVLCGGFSCLLAQARRPGAPYALWGRLAAAGGLLLFLAPAALPGGVSPGRAGGLLLTLLTAYAGGPAAGAAVGVALGAAFDLWAGAGLFSAAAFCFAGLACGFCGCRRRMMTAVCAVVANGVVTLWLPDAPAALPGLYECMLASAALCLLPGRVLSEAEQAFARRPVRRGAEGGRLTAVSRAVGALGASLEGLWEEPPVQDPAEAVRYASDKVCRGCAARARCWTEDYHGTMDCLSPLLPRLRREGAVSAEDFPARFAAQCLHLRRFCGALNDGQLALLRREAAAARDAQARENLRAQCAGLQAALREADAAAELHPALEGRARQVARAYVPRAQVAVWSRDGRMHVDLFPAGGRAELSDGDAFLRSLEGALDRAFLPPRPVETARGTALRVSQRERLALSLCGAARPRSGERVCGDATLQLHTPDGRAVVMLSDGMGAGPAAARAAQDALSLLAGFSRAGCGLSESAAAVLPTLNARLQSRGFVTLDLLEVNLFSGRAQWLKYGAAAGYLLRGGAVRAYRAAALPAGLSERTAARPEQLRLLPGDRAVLMSDGVSEALDAESFLREHAQLPAGELCAALLDRAAEGGAQDDLTVLVAQIRKSAE